MSAKSGSSRGDWVDPDDAPEWTDDQLARAELAIGGKVVRSATGTLTRPASPGVGDTPEADTFVIPIDSDVAKRLRALGSPLPVQVDRILREWLASAESNAARD